MTFLGGGGLRRVFVVAGVSSRALLWLGMRLWWVWCAGEAVVACCSWFIGLVMMVVV